MVTPSPRDRFAWVAELRAAVGQRELDEFERDGELSPAARRAAYVVAVARGSCRLFGGDPGELQGTLSVRMAAAACADLGEQLVGWTEDAVRLSQQWDAAHHQAERDGLCATLLQDRMAAWAAFVALDEACLDEACEVPASGAEHRRTVLEPALDDLAGRLAALDDALSEQEDILSTICELPLLENWRALLRDSPFVEPGLPWWLDGSLEATAAWIDADGARGPRMLQRTSESETVRPAAFVKSSIQRQIEPSPAVAAASEPKPETRTGRMVVVWRSPDGKFLAQLAFPRAADLKSGFDLKLTMAWAEPRGEPAVGQFQKVRLSGMREFPVAPGQSGVVLDSREFFDLADDEPRLLIDGQEWLLAEIIGGDS